MDNKNLLSKIFSYKIKIKEIILQVNYCRIKCKYKNCLIIAAGDTYSKTLLHLLDALKDLSDKEKVPNTYYSI